MAEKITLGEIKEIIKAEKVSPSDLFGIEDLITDASIKGYVESAVKETQNKLRGEAEQRRRGEEGLDKKGKEWENEKEEKDEEIKKLKIAGAKRDATELFTTKMKERKLDKKQISYVEKNRKTLNPKILITLTKKLTNSWIRHLKNLKRMQKYSDTKQMNRKVENQRAVANPVKAD